MVVIVNRDYVDDYLDSCSTFEEAVLKIQQLLKIHQRGRFEIRSWLSNDEDVPKIVAPGNRPDIEPLQVYAGKLEPERAFGLFWEPKSDCFTFKTKFHKVDAKVLSIEKLPMKRELFSLTTSLFESLGFIAHFLDTSFCRMSRNHQLTGTNS